MNKTKVPALVELTFYSLSNKTIYSLTYSMSKGAKCCGKKCRSGMTGLGRHTISNRVLEEGALDGKVRPKQSLKVGNLAK